MIMLEACPRDIHTTSDCNSFIKMNLSPHVHAPDQQNCTKRLECPPAEQKSYSPRSLERQKLPPHITICAPDENGVMVSHFLEDDDLNNDVFQSPTSANSSSVTSFSDEKHKVQSGRLFLICHTGTTYLLSSPIKSPTNSPTQSPTTAFPFQATSQLSAQQSSTPSPTQSTSPKVSVFVRVYRCNSEHFAVITRDTLYTSKPVYVNMRHSRVIPGDCLGRFIVVGQCDSGNSIEFEVPDLSSLEQWLDAFQVITPAVSPHRSLGSGSGSASGTPSSTPPVLRSPVLPTLTETDEED